MKYVPFIMLVAREIKQQISLIFRQHAASIYGFVRLYVCMLHYIKKKINATSKQGRGLRFGMLTVLINVSGVMVLWLVEDDL